MKSIFKFIGKFIILSIFFAGIFSLLLNVIYFASNSRYLSHYQLSLKSFGLKKHIFSKQEKQTLLNEAKRRLDLYEFNISKFHLSSGLVINRTLDGMMLGQCDSLLFSSLRYVSLKKLQLESKAEYAWESILKSKGKHGDWKRHPTCDHYSSRDMIIGILAALSQKPKGVKKEIISLLQYLDLNNGFFSHGPINVSFLTPGVAEQLRQLSITNGISESSLPLIVRSGFSTMEFNSLFLEKGYSSHLVALLVWLEMEIIEKSKIDLKGANSPLWEVSKQISYLTGGNLYNQRNKWVTKKLIEIDSKNLFFRWLHFKTNDSLSENQSFILLKELLSAPQFPKNSLPLNCDRKADYLWQRNSDEYTAISLDCTKQFSGVDFLWMASLILDGIDKYQNPEKHTAH